MSLLSTVATKVWLWVCGAAVAFAMLVSLYASIRRGGRQAQLGDDAINIAKRTRAATQARIERATVPMTTKEEANDAFNRDPR